MAMDSWMDIEQAAVGLLKSVKHCISCAYKSFSTDFPIINYQATGPEENQQHQFAEHMH